MKIANKNIDEGKAFNWGNTSLDYAKFRGIYPQEFYQKIIDRALCIKRQSILDIRAGTGVLPRNLYKFGTKWAAIDISDNQNGAIDELEKQSLPLLTISILS